MNKSEIKERDNMISAAIELTKELGYEFQKECVRGFGKYEGTKYFIEHCLIALNNSGAQNEHELAVYFMLKHIPQVQSAVELNKLAEWAHVVSVQWPVGYSCANVLRESIINRAVEIGLHDV